MATSASLIMIPKPFVEWDHKDVEVFLNHNKQKYILNKDAIDRIVGQEYSGRSLLTLTTDDLVRYGMKDGPARNVMSLLTDLEQTIGVREPPSTPAVIVPPTPLDGRLTEFDVMISSKRSSFRWLVRIGHISRRDLLTAIRANYQSLVLDIDYKLLKFRTPTGADYSPKDEEEFRDMLWFLVSKNIPQFTVTIEKLKPFSSFKGLKELLEKFGLPDYTMTSIRQFSPAPHSIPDDHVELLQCLNEIKRRLSNMGTLASDANEAMRCEYISIILHTSLPIVRVLTGKEGLTLSPQQEIVGEENTGRVDYGIKNLEELICITEGKQSDMGMGLAQNLVQCESAMQVNQRKRSAGGEGLDYVYGIVTTASEWIFIRFATDGISCTSQRPHHIRFVKSALQAGSEDDKLLCKNVREVVEVIVGLLKDRVNLECGTEVKRQRVEAEGKKS